MKRLRHALLAALVQSRADAGRAGSPHGPRGLERMTEAARSMDFAACRRAAARFIDSPLLAAAAVEKAVDFCAVDDHLADSNYACVHFREGIARALEREPEDKLFDAAAFCRTTEDYMLALHGAARVPHTGSGPLLDFKVSPACVAAVATTLAPERHLAPASVPDFWFALCMNQDCAHFLPSRTRWCDIQRQPTHSVVVCEAVRTFAFDKVPHRGGSAMNPEEICALYADFVREVGVDIDAYEHVMHNGTARTVPVPGDQARTLISSRLVNAAKTHYIRDHLSSPIPRDGSGPEAAGGRQPTRSLGRGAADPRTAWAPLLVCLWACAAGAATLGAA